MKLKKHRDGRLGYGVPHFYRFILLGISLIILLTLFFLSPDAYAVFTPGNAVPLLLAFLSLLAALYQEQWTFDNKKGCILCMAGLLFLHKTKTFSLSDVKAIEFTHYRKGGNVKSFLNRLPGQQVWILSLSFHDEKKINIETHGSFGVRTLPTTGKIIAGYCKVPFFDHDASW